MYEFIKCFCYKYGPIYISWIYGNKNSSTLYCDNNPYIEMTYPEIIYATVSLTEKRGMNKIKKHLKKMGVVLNDN